MRNYATITIDETPVGLKFGIPCIRQLVEKKVVFSDKETEGDKTYTELDIAHIFFAGYINNCLVKEVEPSLKLEDFSDYVEGKLFSRDVSEILAAMKVFADSKIIQDLASIGQEEPAENKKKDLQSSGIT